MGFGEEKVPSSNNRRNRTPIQQQRPLLFALEPLAIMILFDEPRRHVAFPLELFLALITVSQVHVPNNPTHLISTSVPKSMTTYSHAFSHAPLTERTHLHKIPHPSKEREKRKPELNGPLHVYQEPEEREGEALLDHYGVRCAIPCGY
jgi:hypothetical protein